MATEKDSTVTPPICTGHYICRSDFYKICVTEFKNNTEAPLELMPY